MSEKVKESLSALMDGEADELELRRLLNNEDIDQVNQQWSRYHLARDVLTNDEQVSFRHLDISKQVSQAISEESKTKHVGGSKFWQPIARFAVAASVAVVVVFGVQTTQNQSGVIAPQTLAAQSLSTTGNRVYPVQGGSLQASVGGNSTITNYPTTQLPRASTTSRAVADLETEKRLDMYILRHTERSALNNSQGMLSFARVASFETE